MSAMLTSCQFRGAGLLSGYSPMLDFHPLPGQRENGRQTGTFSHHCRLKVRTTTLDRIRECDKVWRGDGNFSN